VFLSCCCKKPNLNVSLSRCLTSSPWMMRKIWR
jgi:hypothetical protein